MVIEQEPVLEWQTVSEQLSSGQYGRVVEFLQSAQAASEQTDNAILTDILAAARQICLALQGCQAQVAWLKPACEEVEWREQALRRELYDILELIRRGECSTILPQQPLLPSIPPVEPVLPERDLAEPAKRPRLLHHIRSLLGWRPSDRSLEREAPVASVGTLAITPVEEIKVPAGHSVVSSGRLEPPSHEPEKQKDQKPSSLVVYCLGPFRVYQNDQLIESCTSRKGQAVFKYLVTHRHSPVSKEILMDIFWPDADPEAARRNLHQAIYALRQTLRTNDLDFQHIQFENDGYWLNLSLKVWLDCEEFEQHVQAARELEQKHALDQAMAEYGIAEGLYQGDFLADDLYEDWPQVHREYLWQTYLSIAYRLAQYYLVRGEYAATIALSQRILAMDDCQEEAHQNLMRCYLAHGQRFLAIRQYQLCLQALQTELDLPPSEETRRLYKQVVNG
jgi:DNA-binding SARP family transcriptional activator